MNWILLAPMLALVAVIYAIAAVIGSRRGYGHGMKAFEAEYRKLQVNHSVAEAKADRLEYERDDARIQRDRLNVENAVLIKQGDEIAARLLQAISENADLREALQEKIVEIKALQMQTIEAQSIEPEQVARYQTVLDTGKPEPKRPPRKKAGQA